LKSPGATFFRTLFVDNESVPAIALRPVCFDKAPAIAHAIHKRRQSRAVWHSLTSATSVVRIPLAMTPQGICHDAITKRNQRNTESAPMSFQAGLSGMWWFIN